MAKLIRSGAYYLEGHIVKEAQAFMTSDKKEKALKNTVSYRVLAGHGAEGGTLRFDALVADSATYPDIIRTALACGVEKACLPLTFTGDPFSRTENHYGLSAAKKLGGNYLPPYLATTDAYLQECAAKRGDILLVTDASSAGALGMMTVTADWEVLVKQLKKEPFALTMPQTVAVYLRGKPRKGIGPVDVALDILASGLKDGYFEGKVLEFFGPGLANLSLDCRTQIDGFLRRESGCFSTVWSTDEGVEAYYAEHGNAAGYSPLAPVEPAYYDGAVTVELSRVESMLALPDLEEILPVSAYVAAAEAENSEGVLSLTAAAGGKGVFADFADAECATYEDIAEAAELLNGKRLPLSFDFKLSPVSRAVYKGAIDGGYLAMLASSGVTMSEIGGERYRTDGFGLSDRPMKRAGEYGFWKPVYESVVYCCADVRTMAATAANGGLLTPATDCDYTKRVKKYKFDKSLYEGALYEGVGSPKKGELFDAYEPLPEMPPLAEHYLLEATEGDWATGGLSETAEKKLGDFTPADGCVTGRVLLGTDFDTALGLREENYFVCIAKSFTEEEENSLLLWGVLPLTAPKLECKAGDVLYFSDVKGYVERGEERLIAKVFTGRKCKDIVLNLPKLNEERKKVLLAGGFVNTYRSKKK